MYTPVYLWLFGPFYIYHCLSIKKKKIFAIKHKGLKRKMCWHPIDKKRKNNDRNARFCEFDSRKNTIVNEDLEIRDDVMSLGGTAEN